MHGHEFHEASKAPHCIDWPHGAAAAASCATSATSMALKARTGTVLPHLAAAMACLSSTTLPKSSRRPSMSTPLCSRLCRRLMSAATAASSSISTGCSNRTGHQPLATVAQCYPSQCHQALSEATGANQHDLAHSLHDLSKLPLWDAMSTLSAYRGNLSVLTVGGCVSRNLTLEWLSRAPLATSTCSSPAGCFGGTFTSTQLSALHATLPAVQARGHCLHRHIPACAHVHPASEQATEQPAHMVSARLPRQACIRARKRQHTFSCNVGPACRLAGVT